MALPGRQVTIEHGSAQVIVSEVGAALYSYSVAGQAICPSYPEKELPPKACGSVLVPWPNRIAGGRYVFDGTVQQLGLTEPDAGNAIHGLGRWERWTALDTSDAAVTFGLDIVPQKGYPFEIYAEVTYTLGDDGLTVTMRAANTGVDAAPFGAGAHPFLTTGGVPLDNVRLAVPADARIVVDDASIPIGVTPAVDADLLDGSPLGARRFDAGFGEVRFVDGRATATLTSGDRTPRLWWDEAFPFTQVFTVEDLGGSGPAIAIEPMTCPANAFNSGEGLIVLAPGEHWTGSWGISPNR